MDRYKITQNASIDSFIEEIKEIDTRKHMLDNLRKAHAQELVMSVGFDCNEAEKVLFAISRLKPPHEMDTEHVNEKIAI